MTCSACAKKTSCGCSSSCSCCTESNCPSVCTSVVVSNAWNVPSCGSEAILSVPGLTTVLIGSYIYNPTYGRFRITAFDSVNSQITVLNECLPGNAAPGTVVPALTNFIFSAPATLTEFVNTLSFVVPACDGTVVVDAPGLTNVLIGSYVWNPNYGYFQVTAYDSSTGEVTLLNECFEGNAAPTTVVPAQTSFIFTDAPSLQGDDGWTELLVDPIYASATTFTLAGDWTAIIGPGDRIKVSNPTVKYFNVFSAAFGAGLTTVTVFAGNVYSLAAGAITSAFYSHQLNPLGFPDGFTWTPVQTGFAVAPTGGTYFFRVRGKFIEMDYADIGDGTSNATTYTATLPVNVLAGQYVGVVGTGTDNSVYIGGVLGEVGGGFAVSIISFKTGDGNAGWTAANIKQARVSNVVYRFAA